MRGFPKVCRKIWSFKEWERCVKKVKKKKSRYNPYAVCNSMCMKEATRRKK